MKQLLKVYLAGPQVFLPDAADHFAKVKAKALEYGIEALSPFDSEAPVKLSGGYNPLAVRDAVYRQSEDIYQANLRLIRRCDVVMANVTPFRGTEPDSGTAFEIGYAVAVGKHVVMYSSETRTVSERTQAYWDRLTRMPIEDVMDPDCVYPDGMKAENFGHPFNLMLQHSGAVVHGSFEDAIGAIVLDVFYQFK